MNGATNPKSTSVFVVLIQSDGNCHDVVCVCHVWSMIYGYLLYMPQLEMNPETAKFHTTEL